MRIAVFALLAVLTAAGCRAPYMSEYSDAIVSADELPAPGMSQHDLRVWFEERGYIPGVKVLQAEAELRRRPGDPLVYARPDDRRWWLTAHRTVKHACVTKRTIYYRVKSDGTLTRAIYRHGSQC